MEERVLKLVSQLALIGLAVWVVASAMGKKSQVRVKGGRSGNGKMNPRSIVWRQSPTQAPSASPQLLFMPGEAM
jgi:hypothetical protein